MMVWPRRTAMPAGKLIHRAGASVLAAFCQTPPEAMNGSRGRVDADVDDGRPVAAERGIERVGDVLRAVDREARAAEASGCGRERWPRCGPLQVDRLPQAVEIQPLPHRQPAERPVVQHNVRTPGAELRVRSEFSDAVTESAISAHRYHAVARPRRARSDRGWHGIAEPALTAGEHEVP